MINDSLVETILSNIFFRIVKPDTPAYAMDGNIFDSQSKNYALRALDVANTQIADINSPVLHPNFMSIPRMSTLANGYIINELVKAMPSDLVYLNIGFWCGYSFVAGMTGNPDKRCIAVDNFMWSEEAGMIFPKVYENHKTKLSEVFTMDYRDYFQTKHSAQIGVYFYDADHAYEHQVRGLEIAEKYFAPGCYILVDDTNWDSCKNATLEFIEKRKDQYDLILDKNTANNGHPTFWNGLMIFRKKL